MTAHDRIAGALALPVVVALAIVEPALGLVAGFGVFAAIRRALPHVRLPHVAPPTPPLGRRPLP